MKNWTIKVLTVNGNLRRWYGMTVTDTAYSTIALHLTAFIQSVNNAMAMQGSEWRIDTITVTATPDARV